MAFFMRYDSNWSFDTSTIIGLGYIGLPKATLLASPRQNLSVGISASVMEGANRREIDMVETELDIADFYKKVLYFVRENHVLWAWPEFNGFAS